MASATLQSREIPPEKSAEFIGTSSGSRNENMEISYTGNTGNDMGISTMGYRSSKYNPTEWHENNYSKYYQSFVDRDNGEKIRNDSKRTINETEATTNKTQAEVTKKLGERIQDINFWKFELEREIRDVIDETELLLAQKKRLENAMRATEIPLHIATDNLNCRQRRENTDLVQDDVELSLLKEVEIINNVQDLLKKTIQQSENQIRMNREAKQNLEMDWSDKKEALEIDTVSGALKNQHTNKQFYPGAAKFQEISKLRAYGHVTNGECQSLEVITMCSTLLCPHDQWNWSHLTCEHNHSAGKDDTTSSKVTSQSTPESWAQFSHDNIVRAEHERMASIQLRQLIGNILEDTSRDMREQCDTVDVAFQKRVTEMEDAKIKMEENLKKVCDEITQMEKNIGNLKKAILDKENPMKVAQTRLENRTYRPGVELCRDPAQYKLVGEVNEIHSSIDALTDKLNHASNSLKDLQDNRMGLEREIAIKANSLFIDRDKCMSVRTRYPTTIKLQGYQ